MGTACQSVIADFISRFKTDDDDAGEQARG